MKYYVLRERNNGLHICSVCREWELLVNPDGGMVFGAADVHKAEFPAKDGTTGLFHTNCRCRLTPSPDGIPVVTELDRKLLFSGALGHLYFQDKTPTQRMEMMRKYE